MHRSYAPQNQLKRPVVRGVVTISLSFSLVIALIYFKQHSMVYHPRPYGAEYAQALPANGEEISYTLPFGKQTAFYIPARSNGRLPSRLWVAFCGNASLALDWTTILAGYPNPNDAFLLVDYPGYGKCQGYATIASARATTDAALNILAKRLALSEEEMEHRSFARLCGCDRFRNASSRPASRSDRTVHNSARGGRPPYHQSAVIFADRELR